MTRKRIDRTPILSAEEFLGKWKIPGCTYERWTVERAEGCFQSQCMDCKRVFAKAKKENRDLLAQFPGNGGRVPDLVAVYERKGKA
jgi:hypothetical protein